MAVEYPNWFSKTAEPNFKQFLTPLAGKDKLKFLQLGAFTGDASVWLAENILTGSDCLLTDVDTWEGSEEEAHGSMNFAHVYQTYLDKVKPYSFIRHWELSTDSFFRYWVDADAYDFVYVDADHTTVGVLLDAEHSWYYLKSGGIMAFDDYTWGDHYPMHQRPKPGIDLFLLRHSGEYEVLAVNLQYWIKKK